MTLVGADGTGQQIRAGWTAADIPDLPGRTAIVTGANSGTGYEIALQIPGHGPHVILACRNRARATQAAGLISAAAPACSIEVQVLDLASLDSVRRFTGLFDECHGGLDILVNNAGIAGGPRRQTTDGFEAHFGVNHLGHFALTGLLLPALLARPGSRVVTMSSGLAAQASINFDDLQTQRRYQMTTAYGQSKLASLLFAFELDRRAQGPGVGIASLATHPGVARTNLLTRKEADWGRRRRGAETLVRLVQVLAAQPAAKAALPALYQPTYPAARSDLYIGTKGHMRGQPAVSKIPPAALDHSTGKRLWDISEELTGVSYDSLSQPIQTPE